MSQLRNFESWGRFPQISHRGQITPARITAAQSAIQSVDSPILPRGLGRSYGDSCLNEGGYLLSTESFDKFISFDSDTGVLKCELGVSLDEILRVFVPKGWFLSITPGTKFVTVGGAIANDIHGKNHHREGSFGNHVIEFELLRSDGRRILCNKKNNVDWFRATIGGLGLTGLILWAKFELKPITGPYIDVEYIKFRNLNEFFEISKESDRDFEYTVAWVDCLSTGKALGRGVFMRANHSQKVEKDPLRILHPNSNWKTLPFDAPSFLISKPPIRAFNFLFYNKQFLRNRKSEIHYDPFFYPLDGIKNWNRLYGKRGFLQWQCVVPGKDGEKTIRKFLTKISDSKFSSFLAVLKEFGDTPPEGMLSFPMPGITLALDFPNTGKELYTLLNELDEIVVAFGGKIYPAKDARMSELTFQGSFPEFNNFADYIDPKFSSSFYRRINGRNGKTF